MPSVSIGEACMPRPRINRALDEGRRVVAVGTTTTRALESAAA
jgi:S-adenosylmethionine:tRNA-ribosyltransferase-isomerase (queuine synthetase)